MRVALSNGCVVFNAHSERGQAEPAKTQTQDLCWHHAERISSLGPSMVIIDTDIEDTLEVTQFWLEQGPRSF